jgi:hypothetical protein
LRKDYACYKEFYRQKFLGATWTVHQAPPPLKNVLSYVRLGQQWPRFLSNDNGAEDTDDPDNFQFHHHHLSSFTALYFNAQESPKPKDEDQKDYFSPLPFTGPKSITFLVAYDGVKFPT